MGELRRLPANLQYAAAVFAHARALAEARADMAEQLDAKPQQSDPDEPEDQEQTDGGA